NSIAWSAQFLPSNATPRTGACYVRLAPNGIDIVAATIIGASSGGVATDIALDALGNAYLAGETSPVDFPTNSNSWVRVTQPLNFALFAATVSRDGKKLLATALFNGENFEVDPKIAVAPSGEVVVAGITQSSQFPITPGAFQTVRMGEIYDHNLFVLKLKADLSAPVFSTYLTGEGTDDLGSVWANADGSVTLIGETHSTIFPTTLDAQERCLTADYYPTYVPYLTQIAADGKSLIYSSFLNQGPKGAFIASSDYGHGATVLATTVGNIVLLDPSHLPARPKFCAMNAANFWGTGVTPGEILTIFGSSLGDAQIQIAGQPATVLYQSDGQVNAIVPDGLPEGSAATIAALHQGMVTDQMDLPVVSYVAGLFRDYTTPIVDATYDDGTLITAANPAKPGSIIRVWGTGFGNTHPVIRVGSTIAPPLSSRQAGGVTEFRVLVPQMPAGQSQLMIDFSITGIAFQATGLKLPVAPPAQ
ncbi:MAG TPA: hypothetical protein VGV35_02330, partial [Bryobacteraceae bacterium]|nr:hypothetical protein [Bryobacteraceae bacterium]